MRRVVLVVVMLIITACGDIGNEAWQACEGFVEERIEAEVESVGDPDIDERDDGWYVRADADAGEGVFTYECIVEMVEGEWELGELIVGRPSQ